ncbi:MAG TPA: transporter substrate-binding domain-containing protein, partial [Methylophilaceae bacterium]|nr:transporter substrate-binding domain-containing protein [Methylophilaceae bacterium]
MSILILAVSACSKDSSPEKKTVKRDENVITFVTLNSPSTYYVNSDKEFAGLEYDLANAFLKFIGGDKQIEFIVADTIEEVVATIISNKADIAAADLTITPARNKLINFSIPYQEVQQQVIYSNLFTKRPARKVKDLVGKKIAVPSSSSFVERLNDYKKKIHDLEWSNRPDIHSEGLIEEVAQGEIEYTVADSHLFSVLKNYHPNLRVAFDLGKPEKIAWGFAKKQKPELLL